MSIWRTVGCAAMLLPVWGCSGSVSAPPEVEAQKVEGELKAPVIDFGKESPDGVPPTGNSPENTSPENPEKPKEGSSS